MTIFTTTGFAGREVPVLGLVLLWPFVAVTNTRGKQFKERKMYFGPWFERFQFIAGYPALWLLNCGEAECHGGGKLIMIARKQMRRGQEGTRARCIL